VRMLLAAILIGHGAAHVVGFAVPWKLVTSVEVPYRTTVLAGTLDIGPLGVRLIGILWLLVSVAFVSVAVGVLQHTTWWYREALMLVGVSLMLCVLALPESRPGLVANAVVVALLIAGGVLGWYTNAAAGLGPA
jgi:hypothetical protein